MSIAILNQKHINTIVAWGFDNAHLELYDGGIDHQAVATILYRTNVQAYNAEYDADCPWEITYRPEKIAQAGTPLEALAIVKACDALEYQCSDMKGWYTKTAAEILRWIRGAAMNMVPSYGDLEWFL